VNLTGTDEFTVHICRDGKMALDAVFSSDIRRERWRELLPE
jgi:hypothetical protein